MAAPLPEPTPPLPSLPGPPDDSLASLASLLAAVARTPRVPPLVPGTELGGRYLVLGVLGAGGMGVVYRAHDLQLGREVAVKLCSLVGADASHLYGEAVAMARLSHPNVTTVYEVGRFGADLFVVMELVPRGATARSWIAGRKWRDAVRLYLDAAAGLQAVHVAGLVHGDFKPDNVLVGGDGRARIADFGLARLDGTLGGGGTPRYMAPELKGGGYAGQRSDQFSFCRALAEALASCGGAPGSVLAVVQRGLDVRPARRHESMAALRGELARALERRRRRTVLAGALLLPALLVLIGVWVVALVQANQARAAALRRTTVEAEVEQGRRELAAGNASAALVYLADALESGLDRPAVRFLLARGLAALEETFVELPGTDATAALFTGLGPRVLIGTSDGRLDLYEASDGNRVLGLRPLPARVATLALDPSGQRALAASVDGTARVYDLQGGRIRAELAGAGGRFLDDGRILTWGPGTAARIWDADGRELVRLDHGATVDGAVAVGDVVYTRGADGRIRSWRGGEPLQSFTAALGGLTSLDVDAAGARVAAGGRNGVARVWDAHSSAEVAALSHPEEVTQVRLLPGDRLLTACDDGIARVWDLSSGAVVTSFAGHVGPLTALALSADESRLATASADATVRVWEVATGRAIASLAGHTRAVRALAVSNDASLAVSGSFDGTTRIWSVSPGAFVGSLPGSQRYAAAWFAGRGQVVAVEEGGGVSRFAARPGGWGRQTAPIPAPFHDARAAAISPDGARYAALVGDTLELWDLEVGVRIAALPVPGAGILAFSADGSALLAAGDGATVVYLTTLRRPAHIRSGVLLAAAISPRGDRVALARADNQLILWDTDAGRALADAPGPSGGTTALAFDPSGTWLAVGSDDARVQIFDGTGAGVKARSLGRHGAPVVDVRYAPDGALLYSLGGDRHVRVWDVEAGREVAALAVDAFGGLDVSPDGNSLLVRQQLGRVGFWDVSRDARAPAAVARVVRCLVPFGLDESGHLVARGPQPGCP